MEAGAGAVVGVGFEAGDPLEDELGDGGVLADDDETRRNLDALVFPELEGLLVMAVESLQCCL